jgi:hypothetical protein
VGGTGPSPASGPAPKTRGGSIGLDGRDRLRLGRHLVDTLPAITRANAAVLESYGLGFDADAYRAAYSPDWQEMYARLGIDRSMAEAGARWLAAYATEMDGARPMPRAEEAPERLAGAGLMGLVTAGDRSVVEEQLASTGLGRFPPVLRLCRRSAGDEASASRASSEGPDRARAHGCARADRRLHRRRPGRHAWMARRGGARVGIVSMLGTRDDLLAAGA